MIKIQFGFTFQWLLGYHFSFHVQAHVQTHTHTHKIKLTFFFFFEQKWLICFHILQTLVYSELRRQRVAVHQGGRQNKTWSYYISSKSNFQNSMDIWGETICFNLNVLIVTDIIWGNMDSKKKIITQSHANKTYKINVYWML